MNRETYLTQLAGKLEVLFTEIGESLPPYRVTCGWPSKRATATNNKAIGQCFSPKASKDGTTELIVSMCIDDPMEAAAILAHEMVHAAVGVSCGHKGPFRRVALAIGLEGKMTSTHAGETFKQRVAPMLQELGDYPHAALDPSVARKKDGTRLVKAACPECGYTVRITRKWLDVAIPRCPVDECEMT